MTEFEINKIYKRSAIHDQFGGNRQGGIANCASHPIIFIFTGQAGEKHGYEDGWDAENFFLYTGEGQTGDMTFSKGNKTLLNHQEEGKAVYLFENQKKGLWRFIDQLDLVDFNYFPTSDNNGEIRQGIKFKFKSATGKSKNADGNTRKAPNYNLPDFTERQGLITSRVGQGWYRKRVLEKWNYKCAVTGLDVVEVLIASHIVPWRDATNKERLDPENSILLSPNIDALFDKHLISFMDTGEIVLSNKLSQRQFELLGIKREMKIQGITSGMLDYLKKHKQRLHENN